MEPRIQYAKTSDGVNIAYATTGRGKPPLVLTPTNLLLSLRLEHQIPWWHRWNAQFAEKRTIVRYDARGSGLSERDITAFTLDNLSRDVAAVVDHLGIEKFDMLARAHFGPPAIAYAIAHPGRVSHLVLLNSYTRGADYWAVPVNRSYQAMRQAGDWQIYTEAISRLFLGTPEFATHIRESTTPELYDAFVGTIAGFDVNHLLPEVKCPTLVLHMSAFAVTTLDISRTLASRIPKAHLVVVEGDLAEAHGAVAEAIDEFLGDGEEAKTAPAPSEPNAVHTILFTDIEGSTTLTQRLGDARAQELLRAHNAIVRDALKTCGGSEIKHTGDGIMASFPSASRALECAIGIQRAVAAWGDELPLRVRIGLNAGEPVAEEQDLFGTAVQLARRICDHADAGEILVSNVVRELAAGKGFLFADTGEVVLKGFEDPIRLHAVRWKEDA